jgi:hypothetical protein
VALADWADATLPALPHDDVDAACRARVKALGDAGFLKAVVPADYGGSHARLDVRTLCLAREILAARDGLADFAFAMQGLGTGSISLFGSPALKARYLPRVREGKTIAALPSPSPRQARMWRRWRQRRRRMDDRITSSTAPRPGSPTAGSPIPTWFLLAPAGSGAKGCPRS